MKNIPEILARQTLAICRRCGASAENKGADENAIQGAVGLG